MATTTPEEPCQFSPLEEFEINKKDARNTRLQAALDGALEINENVFILQKDGKRFLFDANSIVSSASSVVPITLNTVRAVCMENGFRVLHSFHTQQQQCAFPRGSHIVEAKTVKKKRKICHTNKPSKCNFMVNGKDLSIKEFFIDTLRIDLFGASQTNAGKMCRHLICAIENAYENLCSKKICKFKSPRFEGLKVLDYRMKGDKILEIKDRLNELNYDRETILHIYKQCVSYRQHESALRSKRLKIQ